MKKLMSLLMVIVFATVLNAVPLYKGEPEVSDTAAKRNTTGSVYAMKGGLLGRHCSMHCVMDWGIKASSNAEGNSISMIDDNNTETAWMPEKGNGVGQSITFNLNRKYFGRCVEKTKKMSIKWNGFKVINGWMKDGQIWTDYSRVSVMKVYKKGKAVCKVQLRDMKNWQTVKFASPITLKPDDKVKVVITEIFTGFRNDQAAMTELVLNAEH